MLWKNVPCDFLSSYLWFDPDVNQIGKLGNPLSEASMPTCFPKVCMVFYLDNLYPNPIYRIIFLND